MTILFLVFLILVDGVLSVLLPYFHSETLAIRNRFRDCRVDGPVEFRAIDQNE